MSQECCQLHVIFNNLWRYSVPYDMNKIPKNGVYVFFEKNEFAHGGNRIVRIGTHNGDGQLRSRLSQHFFLENKDRSIFRKNIGRALLYKEDDDFLSSWEIDMTTKTNRDLFEKKIDKDKLLSIEKQVSEYMQKKFSFVVFEVQQKETRLYLESRIIATVAQCHECIPSDQWLGFNSPVEKIKKSGLWQAQHLDGNVLSQSDMQQIEYLVNQ